MIEKAWCDVKPTIRLIQSSGGSVYECKSKISRPGRCTTRYGYGDSLRNAYLNWIGVIGIDGGFL